MKGESARDDDVERRDSPQPGPPSSPPPVLLRHLMPSQSSPRAASRGKLNRERGSLGGRGGLLDGEQEDTGAHPPNYNARFTLLVEKLKSWEWPGSYAHCAALRAPCRVRAGGNRIDSAHAQRREAHVQRNGARSHGHGWPAASTSRQKHMRCRSSSGADEARMRKATSLKYHQDRLYTCYEHLRR